MRYRPTTAPGLKLWLRADRNVTLVSEAVSAWGDLSGSGATVSQGTAAQRPALAPAAANTQHAVRGSSNNKRLDVAGLSAPSAMTLFVALTRATNASTYVLSGTAQSMGVIENFVANTIEWFGNTTDRLVISGTRTSGPHIVAVTQVNSGQLNVYYDGALTNSKGTAAVDLLALGALMGATASIVNGTDGDLFEVCLYDRVLGALDRQLVTQYLARRYGVAVP